MTETELAHAEARLGPLPAEYRHFLLTAPPADLAALGCGVYHVGRLIKENARVRRWPADCTVRQADGTERPWPADWFMVSDNGGGDYWFVRVEDGGRAVWFWSHESREAQESAPTVADHLADSRDRRQQYARPVEALTHPAFGPLTFDGHRYVGSVGGLTVAVSVIPVPPRQRSAVLNLAGGRVPQAAAAERAVLEAALPGLLREQHEELWWLPGNPRLTADQLRGRLTGPTLNVHPTKSAAGWTLEFHYLYDGGEAFGWDAVLVRADADLRVTQAERMW